MKMGKVEFVVGEEVEVTDEEFKDSWYSAKVIGQVSCKGEKKKKILIEYEKLMSNEKDPTPCKEYVYVDLVRPRPPPSPLNHSFQQYQLVDAFHANGWWKGTVTEVVGVSRCNVTIHSSIVDDMKLEFGFDKLRVHQEWIDGKWVIPQNQKQPQDTVTPTHNEVSIQSPDPNQGPSFRTDMVTPQTPCIKKEIMRDDVSSVSISVSGMIDNQSTAQKTDLLSSVSSIQENVMQSNTNSEAEVTSPTKKAKTEATEVPTYIKACQARGTSARSATDTQDVTSFQSTKGIRNDRQTREARHPISSSEDNCVPSNTCKEKDKDDSAKNSSRRKRSIGSSSHLLDVLEVEQSEVVISLPTPHLQCQEKKHLLPTSQMKDFSCGKKIKVQGVEETDTPMVDDIKGNEDKAFKNSQMIVAMDCAQSAQSLLPSVVECQSLSLCVGKSDPSTERGAEGEAENSDLKENRAVSMYIEQSIPSVGDTSTKSLEPSIDVTLVTKSPLIQQDEAPLLLEKTSLPFTKCSNQWETIKSMEIFKLIPQSPHFGPLEKETEGLREGLALGYTWAFAALWGNTCKANLDDPETTFENILKALTELEKFGFIVDPIRARLKDLKKMRESYTELGDRSRISKIEVDDKSRQCDEIQELITQLNLQLQSLNAEKKKTDSELDELRRMVDGIEESIQGTRHGFHSLRAAPL